MCYYVSKEGGELKTRQRHTAWLWMVQRRRRRPNRQSLTLDLGVARSAEWRQPAQCHHARHLLCTSDRSGIPRSLTTLQRHKYNYQHNVIPVSVVTMLATPYVKVILQHTFFISINKWFIHAFKNCNYFLYKGSSTEWQYRVAAPCNGHRMATSCNGV